MKKLWVILVLMMFSVASWSGTEGDVNQELAIKIAAKKMALITNAGEGYRDLDPVIRTIRSRNDTLTFYIVGFSGRPGYVIVSGTKLMPPVIGVVEKTAWDTTTMPPALKAFLRNKEAELIRNLRVANRPDVQERFLPEWDYLEKAALESTDAPGIVYEQIGPWLHTAWDQGWPYNAYAPYIMGRCPAGCGPIAMAQIMRYHEYPPSYDWSQMGTTHTDFNAELAGLIEDCGDAAGTTYTNLGSATEPWDIDNALKYTFDYDKPKYYGIFPRRDTYKLMRDIRNGFPVIIDGYEEWNIFDWHIFVADGFDGPKNGWTLTYHINWGWGGSHDGWFELDSCNPPGDPGPYNYSQGATIHIRPPAEVRVVSPTPGMAFPSRTPVPIAWQSLFRAGDMDSAWLCFYQWDPSHSGANERHLMYDTLRVVNQPGNNVAMYSFKKPACALTDTGRATLQIVVFGHYGDNAKYRFFSEEIPLGVYHGEYMQFTSPVAGNVWQANMHHTVSWIYNAYTNPEFLIKYKKVSGPPEAPVSGQVVFRTQEDSVDWLIPPTMEGTYYIEGTNIGDVSIVCRSGNFTIAPLPTLNITEPISNMQYQPGEVLPIRWTSNATENMRIKLTRWDDWDPADTLILAASTPNDGVFDWTIPAGFEPGTLYSVTVCGTINPQIMDGVFYFTIIKKMEITSPTAGAEWQKTKPYYLNWTSNFTDNIDFELYRGTTPTGNGGSNVVNDGSIFWTVPEAITSGVNYRFRVQKTGDPSVSDYSDFFSIIDLRAINVTSPAPNVEWQRSQTYNITWTSNVANGFRIELLDYRNNPPNVTLIHAFNYSGYAWTIPVNVTPGSMYKIRVTSTQYPDVSGLSEFFTVQLAPYISVSSPSSMSFWPTATSQTITWSDNISGNVEILLYKQSGVPGFITTIASSTPSDGSFEWFVPQTLTPGSDYYIVVRSLENTAVMDGSDLFTITQGNYILVTAPTAGTQWAAGTYYKIYWNDNITENVMIILRKPSLGIQDTISASTPSDGEYKWLVPTNSIPATNYNFFIRSVNNPNIYDYSDPFQITSTIGSYITVTSPTADSVWKMGTQRTITWDDNISEPVDLFLFKGAVLTGYLGYGYSGNSHTFMVPTSLTAGSDYKVKAVSSQNSAIYDFSPLFSITPADFIDYTGPVVFRMNDTVTMIWNDNINEHVKIELLLADTLYSVITSSTESDGSYVWGVPGNLPVEQWYKIRISSVANPLLKDVSNPYHIYFPYYVDIFNPEAGLVMLKGSSYPVQWNNNFSNGEHFHIDLYKGGDSIRRVRSYQTGSYYLWPINVLYEDLVTGSDYSFKVSCVEYPAVTGFSETFGILDCDSVLFSIGNDTVLYRNGEIDLIATDGFDSYFWTQMQATTRILHLNGSIYPMPDTVPVICTASFTSGCIKQDTLLLTIADPPCLANAEFTIISYQDEPLCKTYTFCNLSDSTLGYRIQYDFGDVTMVDTTSVVVTHSFPGPGTYFVTCTVYDPAYPGCQDVFIDTLTVEPAPSVGFNYTVTVDTGLFVPVISGPGIYRVHWTVDSLSAQNLLGGDHYTDTLQVVFPANGTYTVCAEVYDTLHPMCHYFFCQEVSVTAIPPCRNTNGYFAVSPYDGYGSGIRNRFRFEAGVNENLTCHQVTWNLGDGTPVFSDSLNFSHTYSPGTYVITMTVTDCGSCTYLKSDTVTAYPTLQTGLPPSATGCDSLTLTANQGYFYYVWQDSTESPALPVFSSGNYWILVSDGNGYYHIDTTAASVYPTTHVEMDPIPVLCSDGSTYVLTEGIPSGGTYDGDHITGNLFDIAGAGPGFYPVIYYFQNSQGCSDTAYGVIEVEPVFEGSRIIQNKSVSGAHYFTGDTIFTGSAVTDTIVQGPCLFLTGSETILKAQASIRLLPGTRVMPAGHLNAYIGALSCLGDNGGRKLQEGAAARSSSGSPDLLISPNPAADHAVLFSRTGTLDGYRMNLFNATGRPMGPDQVLGGKQVRLDLQRLQPGVYFVRVWNERESRLLKLVRE